MLVGSGSTREYFWQASVVADISDGTQKNRGRRVPAGKCLVESTYQDGTKDERWVWLSSDKYHPGEGRLARDQWRLDLSAMGDMLDAEAEADAQVGGYNSDTEQNAVALGSGGEDDNE